MIAYLYLCETSMFKPSLDGSTPEETLSIAWFRRGEIEDLDLVGKFRDDWVKEIHLRDQLGEMKSPQNLVNENGEWMVLDDPDRMGAGMGSRWVYPHHANGEEYAYNIDYSRRGIITGLPFLGVFGFAIGRVSFAADTGPFGHLHFRREANEKTREDRS